MSNEFNNPGSPVGPTPSLATPSLAPPSSTNPPSVAEILGRAAAATDAAAQIADAAASIDPKIGKNTGLWIRISGAVASLLSGIFRR